MTVNSAEFSMRTARPVISFRPPCFIKPSATGDHSKMNLSSSAPVDLAPEMKAFIRTFDNFCQKVYMEGFLYKHTVNNEKVRCYAELAGSILSVWDAQVQSPRILPQYYHMSDATVEGHGSKNTVTIHMSNGSRKLVLEAQDEPTMLRWVVAIRLSCFENTRLHMLFSLRLLLQNLDPQADMSSAARWESACQVRLPGRQDWQKFHAVVNNAHSTTKKKSLFKGSDTSSNSKQQRHHKVPQLCLMDSKKSKSPDIVVTEITNAYTLYPESPQLLDKGLMMRVDGIVLIKGKEQAGHLLIMTEDQHHLCTGLFAIYDAYKLYGRPHTLRTDASDEMALNYGCTGSPRLFLETEDLLATGMPATQMTSEEIDRICLDALHRKLSEPIRTNGMRANSLPLITVAACDDDNQQSTHETATIGSVPLRQRSVSVQQEYHMFSRQVADSSDEEDEEDEDEEQEDEEDPDSDDEPIGKAKASAAATPNNKSTSSLIPDFDFGNGFDVGTSSPRLVTATLSSDTSQSLSSLPSPSPLHPQHHNHYPSQQQDDQVKQGSSASSLFGDFSLSMDFGKYMNNSSASGKNGLSGAAASGFSAAASGTTTPAGVGGVAIDRKFSSPSNSKLYERESVDRPSSSGAGSSASSRRGGNGRRSSWDQWPLDDLDDDQPHRRSSPRNPYDDMDNENGGYDLGPMIPSLADHFAPQNSLLDTYLGDQLTAKEQIQYCRATGQPLIQVEHSSKPRIPEGGFVGMISRREKDRKEGNNLRVSERVLQHHADLEREKERRLLEQRQQQWVKHHQQLMMFGPPAPPPMMYPPAPMHPYMPIPSPPPLTPTGPLPPGAHYMVPPGYMAAPPPPQQPLFQAPFQQQQHLGLRPIMINGPRSPSISSPASPNSRRSSRPFLEDLDDDAPVINSRYNNNTRPAVLRKD
ncbi:hypothetical protein BX666DRAFT_1552925 [Dichotomocladium elegans]|nr:hypothetical protein BX666DRAFT_1552925 [Dichotomocladium elegans]